MKKNTTYLKHLMIAAIFCIVSCDRAYVLSPSSEVGKPDFPEVESPEIFLTDESNVDYQIFKESDVFAIAKETIPDFEVKELRTATFKAGEVKSFVASLPPLNGMQRDLMIVIAPTKGVNKIVAFVREQNISASFVKGKTVYNGRMKWYSATGEMLNEMDILNNKISNLKLYDNKTNFKSARVAKTMGCCWQCTEEQFNATYLAASKIEDTDWLVNVACNFNPCFISYLAAAAIACTVCD